LPNFSKISNIRARQEIEGPAAVVKIDSLWKFPDELFPGSDLGKEVFSLDRYSSISLA
jgi:hypothetical protein